MATVLGLSHQTSLGTAAEELEGGDHPFEDGLGALERQRQDERGVGVGPGRDEERDEPATVGEIDVDVAEIGLEALAREMSQGDEGLLMPPPMLAHVALHLGIPAAVAVLVAKASEDLSGGVPLLGRCGLVVDEDLVDDRLEPARAWEPAGSWSKGSGWGSACTRTCRTVFRECPNCRAICRMDIPSRRARRIAP